jgi:hypothetical protein
MYDRQIMTTVSSTSPSPQSAVEHPRLGEREVEHVRRAIEAAPLREDPSPFAYVESFFSDEFYREMLAQFPTEPGAFERWFHGGDPAIFFGNYDRRWENNFPKGLERLSPSQRTFWSSVSDFLRGPAFATMVLTKFRPFFLERFGSALDDPGFYENKMRGAVMLNKHDPGYYLGPHTDRFEKIATLVFYMPESPGLEHLGTTLYAPKEAGFTCRGTVHHDPANFTKVETIPFRANSAFLFARSDVLFHGVERLTDAELCGSARPGFQMQFWER